MNVRLCSRANFSSCGRRAVFVQNLADHASGKEPREACEIDGGFGVSDPLEHSTIACAKRRNVSRASQIGRHSGRIDCDANSLCAILRADAGSHTESCFRVDADREGSALLFRVFLALLRKLKLVGALASEGETNPSAGFLDHEIYELRRDQLRRTDKVTLVFAVFVVRNDDELACLYVGDRLLDCPELHSLFLRRPGAVTGSGTALPVSERISR